MPSPTSPPPTLALETSSTSGSLALLDESGVRRQCRLPRRPRVAQTLIPAIDDMLRAAGWRPSDLGLVAVVQGPGSFTGLRVGVTAAKTLAYALRIDILGIDTLEVMAWQAFRGSPAGEDHCSSVSAAEQQPAGTGPGEGRRLSGGRVHAVLDAQRGELYQAAFEYSEAAGLQRLSPTRIVDPSQWSATLAAGDWLTGGGLRGLPAELVAAGQAVPEDLWDPQAAVVGLLARQAYLAGRRDDYWKLAPRYYRQSAAEEKAASSSPRS